MVLNKFKRKLLSNIGLARVVVLLLIITLLSFLFTISFRLYKFTQPYFQNQNLVSSAGRTNILLLGMRGESRDGPDMTDTMIIASINHQNGKITLISLPRDLWSNVIESKINSAYHLGYLKSATEGGILLAKTVVSDISGTPIHYSVGVDFSLFVRAIDSLGGLDINVAKSFEDLKYPIPGKENDLCEGDPQTLCRYQHLKFDQGLQHMDGDTALKYVRSRQSTDPAEGTDFARSKRQEQVITSIKNKLMTQSPRQLFSLYQLVTHSILTDISLNNYLPLAKLLLKSRHQSLDSYSLIDSSLLINPPVSETYGFQWVLVPKNNDYASLAGYIDNLLK